MAELNIPTEIKDKSAFPQVDKTARQIIAYAVLMEAKNQDAFLRFHPEYAVSIGKGKYRISKTGEQDCKNFWSYGKNRDYREQYEKELAEFLGRKQTNRSESNEPTDKRRDKALDKLVSDCLDAIDSNSSLDPEILKDFVAMAKALGVLKEETERQIPALRFLPSRCGECRYKVFVESSVLEGSAIDCCAYCKTRKVAEENGYRFNDGKDLLEIPEDVIKELEKKNNVKLEDIISGRIPN